MELNEVLEGMSPEELDQFIAEQQHQEQAKAAAANPQVKPDAAGHAATPNQPTKPPEQPSALQAFLGKHGPSQYTPGSTPAQASLDNPEATKAFAKAGIGLAAGPMAGGLAEGLGTLGSAAVNAGSMGLQKVADNAIDQKPLQEGVLGSAALGGGLSLGADAMSKGIGKTADWLQQRAMKVKGGNYIPGVGTEAIRAGVRGSQDTMLGQVDKAIEGAGNEAGEAISGLGNISSARAAEPVGNYAGGMKVGDIVPGHSASDYAGALERSGEIAGRGEVPAMDAWELSKKAGAAGYRNQKALQSEAAQLAQLEQQGYSSALKEGYAQANPGQPNAVSDQFDKMSRLYKAKQLLDQDPNIAKGLPLNVLAAAGLGAAAGGASDHSLTGAAKGAALGLALRSPGVQSYGAKGLDLMSQGINSPELIQGLFGLSNAIPK